MDDFYCIFFFFHLMERAILAIKAGVYEGRTGAYLSTSYNTRDTRVLSVRKGVTAPKGKVHLENVNFEFTKLVLVTISIYCSFFFFCQQKPEE